MFVEVTKDTQHRTLINLFYLLPIFCVCVIGKVQEKHNNINPVYLDKNSVCFLFVQFNLVALTCFCQTKGSSVILSSNYFSQVTLLQFNPFTRITPSLPLRSPPPFFLCKYVLMYMCRYVANSQICFTTDTFLFFLRLLGSIGTSFLACISCQVSCHCRTRLLLLSTLESYSFTFFSIFCRK